MEVKLINIERLLWDDEREKDYIDRCGLMICQSSESKYSVRCLDNKKVLYLEMLTGKEVLFLKRFCNLLDGIYLISIDGKILGTKESENWQIGNGYRYMSEDYFCPIITGDDDMTTFKLCNGRGQDVIVSPLHIGTKEIKFGSF